ncbi:18S rRNA maturation protein [Serendipita sp. 411]|nr:18S rRNA maturation protein [Serendipita sp. 397]KAG8838327.1 18S rRNA maturation protein [Serendipita sp. 405]KAG8840376.1 18S rRNA maturation protein [Serendipita sp. 411]
MSSSKPHKGKERSSNHALKHRKSAKRYLKGSNVTTSEGLPGVQKLKAALRQVKRLLAKENLAADLRVATERRLKSLEDDLAKAEQAKVERTMATRYHKVKFFERQKALRKIGQISKTLESGVDAEGEKLRKKQRKALEKDLLERRIDLNYIVNYPKTIKYIALYASHPDHEGEESTGEQEGNEDEKMEESTRMDESGIKRAEMRSQIRRAMESGELSAEPEKIIGTQSSRGVIGVPGAKKEDSKVHRSNKNKQSRVDNAAGGVLEDNFFEAE